MKRILATSLALALGIGSASAAGVMVVGHRGTGSNAPGNPYVENTLPSIEKAFAEGADLVEVDVQLEAGDQVVLWHDDDMAVAGKPGMKTWDLFYKSMPMLRSPRGGEVAIPILGEALQKAMSLAKGPIAMDIEIKLVEGQERRWLVQEVARAILKAGAQDKVVVTSFDMDCIRLMERVIPGIQTGYLTDQPGKGWALLQKVLGDSREPRIEWIVTTRDFRQASVTPEALVRQAKAQGVKAGVWTVNDPGEMKKFIGAGFEMVITDEPDRAP